MTPRPKYRIVREFPLITLRVVGVLGFDAGDVLRIKAPFGFLDTAFYEEMGWGYISKNAYIPEANLAPYKSFSSKEEANAALKQAELTHRLSI